MELSVPPTLSGRALALRAEQIDSDAWFDQWRAAPTSVTQALGLSMLEVGALRMVRSVVPFSHFNMVLTLGCPAQANQAAFDHIQRFYADHANTPHWILLNDWSEPRSLPDLLLEQGYREGGSWDRVVSQSSDPALWADHANGCELVTPDTAAEWSRFIVNCYGMPPIIQPWLLSLVERPGWIHALRRKNDAPDGPIAMVRSLFHDQEGWAWLGIDAPVPGVMAPCFEDDQKLVATLLRAAHQRGVRCFVSDIEQPSASRDTTAYRLWAQLGLAAVYQRRLFVKHPTSTGHGPTGA